MTTKITSRSPAIEDETLIGLEIHVQLTKLKTKLFCGCSTDYRGKDPNLYLCPICLGLPGSLPVVNRKAVEFAIMVGLALDCEIPPRSIFHRKNYYYPDLPKNYQISQFDFPVCHDGYIMIPSDDGKTKKIGITRTHLEEDAGKSIHDRLPDASCIDLNRAGVPLLEIVTEPDLRSGEEAQAYLGEIRRLVRYLEISDGNMEEGSLRCDANVSVKEKTDSRLGTRTEIKNLNSISNVR